MNNLSSNRMNNRLNLSVLAVTATCLLAGAANASVISTSGPVSKINRPSDARLNVLTNSHRAMVWNEAQNVALADALWVDAFQHGKLFDQVSDLKGKFLPANLVVSSHYVHFDSACEQAAQLACATITFDKPIVGVIMLNKAGKRSIDDSDAKFGMGTHFTKGLDLRGLELDKCKDSFSISNDGRKLTFSSCISNPGDFFRVLTSDCTVVPTPGAAALIGVGGLLMGRRRRA